MSKDAVGVVTMLLFLLFLSVTYKQLIFIFFKMNQLWLSNATKISRNSFPATKSKNR